MSSFQSHSSPTSAHFCASVQKPAPGRAHPCEEAGGRTQEALSPFPEDHVPAQPGGGPAPRPLPPRLSGSCPAASGGARGLRDRRAALPALSRTGRLSPGSWGAGGVEAGAVGRVRISPASSRLPVSGGDLKDRGRRGSRRLQGADQTDLRAALCSPRILHRDSGPGGKAGPSGPGSGPCARAGKMATPPAETAPPGHRRGQRTSLLHGLYHSHPFGLTPQPLLLHLCLFSGKGEEGPGPELHSGCLDGLRSLFEGPPCPCPGALIPFQAPGTAHPSPATPSGDPSMEEHLAVMYERLRQELPNLFLHSHDYTLYSSDVEFINEILNMRTKGRTWYILSLTLCRFLAWNYFAQLRLEILQLTRHPENWTLQARWRLVGLPIHLLFLRFYKRDKEELYRTYDAYSTFYLNSNGLICRHRLDKLMPSHSPPAPVKKLLVGALVALGLSEPEPNLHLCSKD
ncbi:hypothetical protein AB1E18_016716 [Capra hircus]